MIAVLDACAGIRAIVGSRHDRELLALLEAVDEVVAPAYYRLEVVSALKKYVDADLISQEESGDVLQAILGLVDRYLDDDDLNRELLYESIRLKHSPYDVLYLIVARRLGAALVSLDDKLNNLADREGLWIYFRHSDAT